MSCSQPELADRLFLNVWSKSGRPVSLTTVFADCGRLESFFFPLWCTEMLFWFFHGQMCFYVNPALFTVLLAVVCFPHFHTQPLFLSNKSLHISYPLPTTRQFQNIVWLVYCKLDKMGSFPFDVHLYKCTMSIFLWCPTICIRNGQ